MELIDIIRALLGPAEFNDWLKQYSKQRSVPMRIRKLLFTGTPILYPDVKIPLSLLEDVLTNAPVVRRGTKHFALDFGKASTQSIEVQGIDLSHFMKGAELNNLKSLGKVALKQMLTIQMNKLSETTDKTVEALCAQSLTGSISYPMKTEGGALERYEIDLGTPLSHALTTKLDASGATIMDVYTTLTAMHEKIKEKGFGDKVVTLAGSQVFNQILKLAEGSKTNLLKVEVGEGKVSIAGYVIELESGTYQDVIGGSKQVVSKVDAKKLVMFDQNANQKLYYLALDDLDAGLKPLPIYIKAVKCDNPSGIELLSSSKPFPALNMNAVCWSSGALT